MASDLMSLQAVARVAGVSRVAVWKAIRKGRLRGRAVYGPSGEPASWAVARPDAERWARQRAGDAGAVRLIVRAPDGRPLAGHDMPRRDPVTRRGRPLEAVRRAAYCLGLDAEDLAAACGTGTRRELVAVLRELLAVIGEQLELAQDPAREAFYDAMSEALEAAGADVATRIALVDEVAGRFDRGRP